MEDKNKRNNFKRSQRMNDLQDSITDGILSKSSIAKSQGIKGDGNIHPLPAATSMTWLHNEYFKTDDDAAKKAQGILGQINKNKVSLFQSNDIAGSINDVANYYKNQSQYTWEMVNYLSNEVLTSPGAIQYALVADTEWLGGGKAGKAMPVEVGYQVIAISKDGVEIVDNGQFSSHMQLTKRDYGELNKLITKVRNDMKIMSSPQINEDDYRTLKDLVNIADEASMNPNDRANKAVKHRVMDGDNIGLFIEDAAKGLEILSGGSEAKINTRTKAANDINKLMLNYKDLMGGRDMMVLSHNGLMENSDLDVWNSIPGLSKTLGNKKHIDTLSILRTVLKDPLTEVYGNVDSVNKPLTLEDIANVVIPKYSKSTTHRAHTAGSDAEVTAMLFKYIWEDPDKKGFREKLMNINSNPSNKWGVGTKLYSTGTIQKETPLDMVLRVEGDNVLENRYYSSTATYRNATYEIQEEFKTKYGNDIYYGVVLKNQDDKTTHYVTAKTQRDLQSKIQGNFTAMDNEAIQKGSEASRNYVLRNRAMTEYADMFAGPNAPYRFNQYVDATTYIRRYVKNATDANGLLTDKAVEKLIKNEKLTYSQAQKFKYMYQRINSEYDVLREFKDVINEGKITNSSKSVALWKLKEEMDNIYGSHKTSLSLPEGIYNQGRIRDYKGNFVSVDLRSQETLARSLSRVLLGESGTDFSYDLSDIKANARTMVQKMSYGANPLLEKRQSQFLIETINKLNVKSITGTDQGYTSGVSYIAQAMAQALYDVKDTDTGIRAVDAIEKVTQIDDVESLGARVLKPKRGKKNITKENMLEIKEFGARYFATKDSPLKFNAGQVETKLNMIDKAIVGHINEITGGAITKAAKEGRNIGPTSIIKELEQVAKTYKSRGIKMQVDLTDGDNVGLQIKLFADEYATNVTRYEGKKAAEIFIPLMDPKTGMLQGSTRTMNLISPVMKKGKAQYSTYQQEIINLLTIGSVADIMETNIKYGDVASATSFANNLVKNKLLGLPIGSMYNKEINSDFVASNPSMNTQRRGIVDLNSLIYGVTKKNNVDKDGKSIGFNPNEMRRKNDLTNPDGYWVDGNKFLNYLYIGPEYIEKNFDLTEYERYAIEDAKEVYKIMQELGMDKFNLGALKGERAQKGFINLTKKDPRNYFIGGWYGDPAREMARQGLNFFTMSGDDYISDNGIIRKRKDFIESSQSDAKRRMLSRYSETTDYHKDMDGIGSSITLRTAFITDKDIEEYTKMNLTAQQYDQIPIAQRLSVHDEMGVIDSDALKYFTVNREKNVVLGSEYNIPEYIRQKLDAGETYTLTYDTVMGEAPSIQDLGEIKYKERYDMVVRGYTLDKTKGSYVLVGDQIIEAGEGTKMSDTGGGSKLTAKAANDIAFQLGDEFKGIQSLMNLSMDKGGSGTAISSQINMAMEQIQLIENMNTVGKVEKKKIQSRVNEIAAVMMKGGYGKANKTPTAVKTKMAKEAMQEEVNSILKKHLGTSNVKFVEQEVNGVKFTTAVVSSNVKKDLNLTAFMEDFDSFFVRFGIDTRHNYVEKQGKKVRIGNVALNVVDVDPGNKIVGAGEEQVKIGVRNVEFLRNRSKYLDVDMTAVTDYFEGAILESAKDYNGEGKWMANSLLEAGGITNDVDGKPLFDSREVGYIKSTGRSTADESKYFGVKEFGDLNTFSINGPGGQVSGQDLRGTIVDNIFDNRAFYLELPEEVTFGSKGQFKTNKVLMTPTSAVEGPDGVYLREVQKKQKALYDSVTQYKNFQKKDKSKMHSKKINAEEEKIRNRMSKAVGEYYHEVGKSIQGANGEYVQMVSTARMSHSGRFAARGINPSDELTKNLTNKLNEGDILVTKDAFMEMISGGENMTDEFKDELLAKARKDGIYGMTIRDPVKDYTSELAVNIRVMSEVDEKAYKAIPGMKQSAIMTLGTQIALGADFDGDQFALLMPLIGGTKAKNLEELMQTDLYKTMDKWFTKEKEVLEENAVFYKQHSKLFEEEGKKLSDTMFIENGKPKIINVKKGDMPNVGSTAMDASNRVLEVASRMNKQVGQFSVMSSRYRALAETVGSAAVDSITKEKADFLYSFMTFVGSGNEQAPISSKRLAELFKSGVDNAAGYQRYMEASQSLYTSLKSFDKEGIIQGMKDTGMFEEVEVMMSADDTQRHYRLANGYGELDEAGNAKKYWRLKGGKTEGMFASSILQGDPNIILTDTDVLDMFTTIEDTVGKDQAKKIINGGAAGLGFATPYNEDKAISNMVDLMQPTTKNATVSSPLNIIAKNLFGEEMLDTHASRLQEGVEQYSKTKPMGKTFKRVFSEESAKETADAFEDIAKSTSSDMLSKIGIGAAVLGGGAWLASAIIPGPSTRRNVQQGQEDQAPSSDGTYVNPAIYAGAPPGAAPPTARVSPMGAGYDKVSINVSASSMNGMTNEEIANVIAGEVQRQSGVSMNINIKSEDNTTNIDRQWLQQQFSNALNTGWTY